MKYGFVKEHRSTFSVSLMCQLFQVSTSGFYDWNKNIPSQRERANQALDANIIDIFNINKFRYGSPRITKVLNKKGIKCSQNRVAHRMTKLKIRAVAKKKFKVTTDSEHTKPIFMNVLARDFTTTAINQKWVGDITYIATEQGWLYLAVIIDLHSRAVIGWSMSKRMTKQLVCDALLMALFNQKFPQAIIVHSDRGSQYCSKKYRNIIKNNKLIGSMSRRGNCWDNAISESFFHTLKVELVHQQKYKTRTQARQSIFQYIEGYYNRKRMHSSIDYRVPYEVECGRRSA